MSALTLTAVLVVAGLGAAGCVVLSVATVAWLVRDARKSRDAGEATWSTAHRSDGNVARRARRDRASGGAA